MKMGMILIKMIIMMTKMEMVSVCHEGPVKPICNC